MDNIVLKFKNYEVMENDNSLYELRKDGNVLVNMIDNMNTVFETIQTEENKEQIKSHIRQKFDQDKENTILFLNNMTKLHIREISYQELIKTRTGFTQKGFLINEGTIKRILMKEELIDLLLSFYNDDFKKFFEYTNA